MLKNLFSFNSDSVKVWFWVFLNGTLVAVILFGIVAGKALYRYGASLLPSRTISVSAEGKTIVSPDIASVSFTVVSQGADPEKLAVENTEKMNAAIEYVKSEGVADKDIKTANYDLSPLYEYDEKRRTSFITGYTLTQTVFVKIRDFTKIGKVLGKLPDLGINQISSLTFDIDNPDVYLNEARALAFEKARAKAKTMAKQNRTRLGRVVTFSEGYGGYPRPYLAMSALGKGGAMEDAAMPPQIEPGSQEVTVNVTVTYEIR
ncbi:MAG: hypothetical protein A3H63_01915 [Candidatus Harrisonbacteria bacterium RIFCSPLOWO2_02_FULL_45_10c]|uniref:SIMPL domain-containing protein n=1 Tax=Candidatus Harrisonbacteria bacterium RIFCSPLOWO2_02_FULL_45_10c TaxID=1798410 RepID=A0A1G1ZTJ1_9BACT|nr:MAG: hypothetical protein A3H63_01915 [Candidatus Harrisonbacteria bacterium RIFCSPLOWO2_02_FULL_45_10c]